MSSLVMPFSIHQERWHNAWVAATAAVKSRKKQQVDFDIRQRVGQLLEEYGPQSQSPLTLRVYGTLMKGFCVLNNERARLLYTDCERVVLMFAQRNIAEAGGKDLKLPAAKRQKTDALTLDLDLAKVHDSEVFNWTQTPLEDGALLQLDSDLALVLPEAQSSSQQPQLLEDARLFEESFPADLPLVPLDAAAEAARMAEVAEAVAMAAAAEQMLPLADRTLDFPSVNEVHEVDNVPSILEQNAPLVGEIMAAVADPNAAPQEVLPRKKRVAREPPALPGQGHVFGFDEHTQMSLEECDDWQLSDDAIGNQVLEPEDYAEEYLQKLRSTDRVASLLQVIDASWFGATEAEPITFSKSYWCPAVKNNIDAAAPSRLLDVSTEGNLPAVQALLADEDYAQPNLACPELVGGWDKAPELSTQSSDPFRPYVAKAPLVSMRGADMELASALSQQIDAPTPAGMEQEDADEDVEVKYDAQTKQVADILHRYMARSSGESRAMTLDDLIPPATTDKDVAAKTFLAVLTLATAGDFSVEQTLPFGPIAISLS
mmetsp:Transcript_120572/g.191169  ORF Transcript_120572/g.191169 Transcript_120572/m.191169 type:complete len:544 (+) Transcript_120572:70-1701(+)